MLLIEKKLIIRYVNPIFSKCLKFTFFYLYFFLNLNKRKIYVTFIYRLFIRFNSKLTRTFPVDL